MMGDAGPGMLPATVLDAERTRNQPAARVFCYTSYEGAGYGFLRTLPAHSGGRCGSLNRPGVHAEYWHGHGHPNHHGNNAGAVIVGGLIASASARRSHRGAITRHRRRSITERRPAITHRRQPSITVIDDAGLSATGKVGKLR
jgi:hypothetical protein